MKNQLVAALACVSLFVAGCGQTEKSTMAETYPGPWVDEIDLPIADTLAQNNIQVCGYFKFRENVKDKGEYLVYCSMDMKEWHAFIVWPRLDKVMGPFAPDPTIPAT